MSVSSGWFLSVNEAKWSHLHHPPKTSLSGCFISWILTNPSVTRATVHSSCLLNNYLYSLHNTVLMLPYWLSVGAGRGAEGHQYNGGGAVFSMTVGQRGCSRILRLRLDRSEGVRGFSCCVRATGEERGRVHAGIRVSACVCVCVRARSAEAGCLRPPSL